MTDIMKKYGMLLPNINPYDETFMEILPQIVSNFHGTNENWIERKNDPLENPYLIFKQQLESLLTERDIDVIEEVMVSSNNSGPYGDDPKTRAAVGAYDLKAMERIYYEVYHDDPEYNEKLVLTPIDELLQLHF